MNKATYCGYAVIIGRPNVGKSTLLNCLLGQKISITSRKPQTTRHRILGVKTRENTQVIYLDTPGLHRNEKHAVNYYMNRAAKSALRDVNVVILMTEGGVWGNQDRWALAQIKDITCPVILAINKVDKISDRSILLPYIEKVSEEFKFHSVVPISAKNGDQVEQLEDEITQCMPKAPFYFPPQQITDRSEQFLASEIIREKLTRNLGQELPYALAVTIVALEKEENIVRISAVIWVEKKGQKGIVIGKDGLVLKKIGRQARLDMEKFFKQKVFLQLWVKVKSNWSDSEQLLRELGYED